MEIIGSTARVAAFVPAVGLVVIGCEPIPPDLPENTPVKVIRWLDQDRSADKHFWFHHATPGTSTLQSLNRSRGTAALANQKMT